MLWLYYVVCGGPGNPASTHYVFAKMELENLHDRLPTI